MGHSNENKNLNKLISVTITLTLLLKFPALGLDISCSIGRKVGISKYFFLFHALSSVTLAYLVGLPKTMRSLFKFLVQVF